MKTMFSEIHDILNEWDYEKNAPEGLDPLTLSAYTSRKAWWKCALGHSWKTNINTRTRNGTKCPYCCNQKILAGYNDLATLYPEIAAQWHPTKNERIPQEVGGGAGKKAWWQCPQGHEWESVINSRTSLKAGCPYCARIISIPGVNDLATVRPGLASEWHPSKNLPLLVTNIQVGSDRNVWWQCPQGHEWKSIVRSRTKTGNGCPTCTRTKTSAREMTLRYYITKHFAPLGLQVTTGKVSNRQVDVIVKDSHGNQAHVEYDGRRWHTDARNDVARDELLIATESSLGLIIRIREQGADPYPTAGCAQVIALASHERPAFIESVRETLSLLEHYFSVQGMSIIVDTPDDDTAINAFIGGRTVESNLTQTHPALAVEWHPTKNGKTLPEHLSQGSRTKVWWQCALGHEWYSQIKARCRSNSQCPYCSGNLVWAGFNDLQTTYPKLSLEWHPTKNGDLLPSQVSSGSSRKDVWWSCPNNHEWIARISSRARRGSGCSKCKKQSRNSK